MHILQNMFDNFYPGYEVTNFELLENSNQLTINLEPIDPPVCPHCHSSNVVVHQYRVRRIKDAPIRLKNVDLIVKYRVVRCNCCEKTSTEKIGFKADNFNVTKELQKGVIEDLEKLGSIKDTADRFGICWDTCKEIHKQYLQKTIAFDLGDAKILARDEFSLKRGHKYATVVIDLEARRVIWVGKGKSITEVDEFFKKCGTLGCQQIEAVAMDQNAGFATCVKKYCPNAKVVYDLFHMIYNYGRLVISAIRLRLSNDKKEDNDQVAYKILKNSRFLLLAKNSNLSADKKIKLNNILEFYQDLYAANELKELLPDVFNANSKEEAEKLWNEWYELAMQSEVEEITRFAANQNKRYKEGIINSGIYHIRTSILEGINNKIKVLKRIAFGYRDSEYFFLRIKSAFRGKALST